MFQDPKIGLKWATFREFHDSKSPRDENIHLCWYLSWNVIPSTITPPPPPSRCQRILLMNCHEVIGFIYKSSGSTSSSTCPSTMSNVENSHSFKCRPFLADGGQFRLHPHCKQADNCFIRLLLIFELGKTNLPLVRNDRPIVSRLWTRIYSNSNFLRSLSTKIHRVVLISGGGGIYI